MIVTTHFKSFLFEGHYDFREARMAVLMQSDFFLVIT
jgi:hypothetical protein